MVFIVGFHCFIDLSSEATLCEFVVSLSRRFWLCHFPDTLGLSCVWFIVKTLKKVRGYEKGVFIHVPKSFVSVRFTSLVFSYVVLFILILTVNKYGYVIACLLWMIWSKQIHGWMYMESFKRQGEWWTVTLICPIKEPLKSVFNPRLEHLWGPYTHTLSLCWYQNPPLKFKS